MGTKLSRPPSVETFFAELIRGTKYEREATFRAGWAQFALWPPNVFAFTWAILATSGLYRLAVSPPPGKRWPPRVGWEREVKRLASDWRKCAMASVPKGIIKLGRTLEGFKSVGVEELSSVRCWTCCAAFLELHAASDEA
ncbi:MAG: hypothetical protein ABTD50_23625, partial [Polyangiaceae bacterium]